MCLKGSKIATAVAPLDPPSPPPSSPTLTPPTPGNLTTSPSVIITSAREVDSSSLGKVAISIVSLNQLAQLARGTFLKILPSSESDFKFQLQ